MMEKSKFYKLEEKYWDELDKAGIFVWDGEGWTFGQSRLERLLQYEKMITNVRFEVRQFFNEPSFTNSISQMLTDLAECYEALGKVKDIVTPDYTKKEVAQ